MQDIVSLFGSLGATRYLQLCRSASRKATYLAHALNEDDTLHRNITDDILSFAPSFTDETIAHTCSVSLSNTDFTYDPYVGDNKTSVALNRRIKIWKGLIDQTNGHTYLLPAFEGRITQVTAGLDRANAPTIELTLLDAMQFGVKQSATTDPYINSNVNYIGGDIAERYLAIKYNKQDLFDIDFIYGFFQPTDIAIVDMLTLLYEPLLIGVSINEDGKLQTRPRLGSTYSKLTGILGYPDAETPPADEDCDFILTNSYPIQSVSMQSQNYEGFNQVTVLGKTQKSTIVVGDYIEIDQQLDSTVANNAFTPFEIYFSEHSSGSNQLVCKDVYVQFNYSTNHHLDDSPRLLWDSGHLARQGESKQIFNETGELCGEVFVHQLTPLKIVLHVHGYQFSSGGGGSVRHHGGYDYNFAVYGKPLINESQAITVIRDYNPVDVVDQEADDVFGDHMTYQLPQSPIAMGTPVSVKINNVDAGTNTADNQTLSHMFGVDYERGRIVLKTRSYRTFVSDDGSGLPAADGSHPDGYPFPTRTGGTIRTNAQAWTNSGLDVPTPAAVYQTAREGESTWVFAGLSVDQSYDILMHFADPDNTTLNHRKFSIYVNDVVAVDGFDIGAQAQIAHRAIQYTSTGQSPNFDGTITVKFTQIDPVSGLYIQADKDPGNSHYDDPSNAGGLYGLPIVSGIELLEPQGNGPSPYFVNCGGPVINPSAPVITATYGYSPIQIVEGINNQEINNPYIQSVEDCENIADFFLNYAAWSKYPITSRMASMPHLQCGDLFKFYVNAINSDVWTYIQQISRDASRGGGDFDDFTLYLLNVVKRV